MYSSPAVPGGTMRSSSSSRYARVFHTGRPIGGAPDPVSGPNSVAAIVISVGPYALNIRRPGDHSATSRPGHASPPTIRQPNPRTRPAGTLASTEGMISAWVTASSSSVSASISPASGPGPGSGTTSAAPAGQAISISITAASKLSDASWSTRDSGPIPNALAIDPARLARPRWVITVPFGLPVDPDV